MYPASVHCCVYWKLIYSFIEQLLIYKIVFHTIRNTRNASSAYSVTVEKLSVLFWNNNGCSVNWDRNDTATKKSKVFFHLGYA